MLTAPSCRKIPTTLPSHGPGRLQERQHKRSAAPPCAFASELRGWSPRACRSSPTRTAPTPSTRTRRRPRSQTDVTPRTLSLSLSLFYAFFEASLLRHYERWSFRWPRRRLITQSRRFKGFPAEFARLPRGAAASSCCAFCR